MSEHQRLPEGASIIPFPARVAAVEPDETIASVIQVLQDQLALARDGKLRSVAVATVSSDGTITDTHWSCEHNDITDLIGRLTVLTHDLMASRR